MPGHNVSCDSHLEHLNQLVKTAIEGLGTNKSDMAIMRTGRTIGLLKKALEAFDSESEIKLPSGKHGVKSMEKDLLTILQQLMDANVFDKYLSHYSFRK